MSDQWSGQAYGEEDRRPVPDPTALTNRALDQAISNLEDRLVSKIEALDRLTETRFDAAEAHRVEQKQDSKLQLDAALAAQKEAVREQTIASERAIAKSEASTTKQLEQLSTTGDVAIRAVSDTLSDVKERVGRIENLAVGGERSIDRRRQDNGAVYAAIACLVGIAGLVVAVVVLATR